MSLIEARSTGSGALVRIFELELKAKPCYIGARGVQNGSYKRVDDKDIKMSPAELYELQSALLPSDADDTVVSEATVDDLDPDVVRSIIANRRLQTPRVLRGADTLEKQLTRLNITTKDGAVKLAGLLSAGIYPQQFYPMLMIDVAVHADVEKSAPGNPGLLTASCAMARFRLASKMPSSRLDETCERRR